jgi:hypothetical protein
MYLPLLVSYLLYRKFDCYYISVLIPFDVENRTLDSLLMPNPWQERHMRSSGGWWEPCQHLRATFKIGYLFLTLHYPGPQNSPATMRDRGAIVPEAVSVLE